MTSDWMPVIGISVAVMALLQVATIIAVIIALRRVQTGVQAMERRIDEAVAEVKPQFSRLVDDARATSATATELLTDIRRHLETMGDVASTVRHRVNRVVDGVQTAASSFPVPMKVTGSAAMALWAGVRVVKTVINGLRERRRERHIRDRQFRDAESYIGVG